MIKLKKTAHQSVKFHLLSAPQSLLVYIEDANLLKRTLYLKRFGLL